MGSRSWRSTGRTDAPAASAASRIRSTPRPPPAPCWPGWPPPRPSDATASWSRSGLRAARNGAIKARTAAINQLKGLLVTAPASLREALEGRSTAALAAACARLRPDQTALADPVDATKAALRVVACRIQQLDEEIGVADQRLAKLVGRAAPRLLKLHAIGVDHAGQLLTTTGQRPERLRNEAAFAHLCGDAPIPASSAKTHRHRLHRGGDRDANRALHLAVVVRMRWCPRTRADAERRTKQGRSKPEIMRCVKRYLAREVYHALVADFEALNGT
jgi:transposase